MRVSSGGASSGRHQDPERVRASYDAVADRYVEAINDELRHKPLDRALLTAFAERLHAEHGARPRVCDMGCGPGHVGAFLAGRGCAVTGVDLSPVMVARARSLHPEMTFEVGTMTALDAPDACWDGIAAFYSIIHLTADADARAALAEFHRTLAPRGLLLVAVHLGDHGDATVHSEEMLGVTVDMDFRFFDPEQLAAAIEGAGFSIEARLTRAPYEGAEAQTTRGYFLARRRV